MKDDFVQHFRGPAFNTQTAREFLNIKQLPGETVDHYKMRFDDYRALAVQAGVSLMNGSEALKWIEGLLPDIREHVMKTTQSDMTLAVQTARNVQTFLWRNEGHHGNNSTLAQSRWSLQDSQRDGVGGQLGTFNTAPSYPVVDRGMQGYSNNVMIGNPVQERGRPSTASLTTGQIEQLVAKSVGDQFLQLPAIIEAAVSKMPSRWSRTGDEGNRRRSPSPTSRSAACYECGGLDHFARDCPAKKVKPCGTCGSTRHNDEGCESLENARLRKQIAQLQAQQQSLN